MNLVKNILVGDSAMPSGTNNQPYAFSGNALSVHSPVLIHAYDQSGDHTGPLPNGDYEAKIPGSSYEVLGDAKFIWLPDSGQYTVKFEATGQGTFDFKIRNYANDVNDKTILYNNIPLTTNTKAETIFNTAVTQPPVLQVDQDGNGTVDTQVNSSNILTGDANYDETPPKTTVKISGITGNNGWYKSDAIVELNATDETNGSGIAKTEYSLDNGQTIKIYTQPFPISQEGINKLKFRSKDQAGNEETPQEVEIKIDKTTPEAKISFNLQNQTLEITGSDNLTAVQISGSAEEQVLTDEAGNITKLQFKPDEKDNEKDKDKDKDKNKEKEDDKEKEQEKEKKKKRNKLELKSISYNNGNIIKFPENKFEAKLELDKKTNNVKEFTQSIEIEKQIEIKTDYNPKKDRTSLEIKIPKDKKQKEEKPGIVILNLLTNKGNLEVKY